MNRLLALVWTLAALAGCSAQYRADAGPAPDGSAPMGALEIESEPSLALAFDDEAEIAVRYTESGEAVAHAPIRFAFEGRAHDSTLADLSIDSDSEGRAGTSVVAGSTSSAFRVRVSAERAAPVYVNVSVGNMGFGALVVHAEYAGDRAASSRRVIEIYSSMSCSDERPPAPDRMATLDDPSMLDARFGGLPAGIPYAIFGRVEGPGGVVLATACEDGVELTRDGETTVELGFADAPLSPAGDYDAVLALTPTGSSAWATDLASAAGTTRIEAAGGGAALYLDALEEELRERGETIGADTLAAERTTGVPESTLASRLDDDGGHPAIALDAITTALRARLTAIAVRGPLSIRLESGAPAGTWEPAELAVGPSAPDSPALMIDPSAAGLALSPTMSLSWPMDDSLVLEALTLALPLGELARLTIDAEVSVRGLGSEGELLEPTAGCDALAAWIADSPTMSPLCTADCPRSACLRALDAVMLAVDVALDAGERDAIELSGTIAMRDDNGDLVVDDLTSTELTGTWSGPGEVDPLSGGLTASRSPD